MNGCCFGYVLEDLPLNRTSAKTPTTYSVPLTPIQSDINMLYKDSDYVAVIKPVTKILKVKVNIPELLPLSPGGKVTEKNITASGNFFKNKSAPVVNSKIKTGNFYTVKIIPTLNLLSLEKIAKGSKILVFTPTEDPDDFYGMVI